ncbi:hypothetical protein CCAX7_007720 [Capsulimonas corticalis]|uniref:Rhamnogalacturonan I lyase beta-sheet domain-containing protein n=2 Tax=Capsulimonas corticalis TaxID=2219043 RepID=A0A9N7QC12_9BACT|nr:hypothetical protein CCAX7_007720 [Capsulimonas corticalis]
MPAAHAATANTSATGVVKASAAAPGPSALLVTLETNGAAVSSRLDWKAVSGAKTYQVYRNGVKLATATTTTYLDSTVKAGSKYTYYVTAIISGVETSPSVTQSILVLVPAAPKSLKALPQWTASCAVCGGMAMAHINLSWSASPNAVKYDLYRNGYLLKPGVTTLAYTDMALLSGAQYSYTVVAVGTLASSAPSAAVKAVAPKAPAGTKVMPMTLLPPTNLSTLGTWAMGSTDSLAWTPVDGAASYNVYQYGKRIASGIQGTYYTVPTDVYWCGTPYTVTAVDGMGMESLPSAIATGSGSNNPLSQPTWMPPAPGAPDSLAGTLEWNVSQPRVHLVWEGSSHVATYNIYRDGVKIAEGVWGLNYFDRYVHAGETHTYAVSSCNVSWMTPIESDATAPVSVSVPTSAPVTTLGTVSVTQVTADDDSALVTFAPVPGAVDYRVYSTASPKSMKYSGGSLSIEMNGLNPATGADLVVEAVDKFGPFQTMDGAAGPGAMQMDGSMSVAINGQGDPSDVPNVIARSAQFHVNCVAKSLTGAQAFFDNFRSSQPFVQADSIDPVVAAANSNNPVAASNSNVYVREFSNNKWVIRNYWGDMDNTKIFVMGNHFMDTLFDGGTPHSNIPIHNNNATIAMMPKATADISNGRVLHLTFEVDAHFDSRRWCDVVICPVGDPLIHPAKLDGGLWPTASGNMFRWEIKPDFHRAEEFLNGDMTNLVDTSYNPGNDRSGLVKRVTWDGKPLFNGTQQDLDKRHSFDLYLSQTHYRLVEAGVVVKDDDLATPLPFSNLQPYFLHQLYHTGNDRPEQVMYNPTNAYWYNHRPWSDERHWDNMGFEVLPAFPG